MRPERILYRTEVSAIGGRDGGVTAADGGFSAALSVPKELGGPGDRAPPGGVAVRTPPSSGLAGLVSLPRRTR